jgi:hypothetical protein
VSSKLHSANLKGNVRALLAKEEIAEMALYGAGALLLGFLDDSNITTDGEASIQHMSASFQNIHICEQFKSVTLMSCDFLASTVPH